MAFKFVAVLAFVAVCNAGVLPSNPILLKSHEILEEHAPAHYEFGYSVHDSHTGDIKSQHEVRSGDHVQGQYSLVEPDGSRRVVDYNADAHNGFNAHVRREGHTHLVATHSAPVAVAHHAAPIALAHHTAPIALAHHAAPVSYAHHAAPVSLTHHAASGALAQHTAPVAIAHHATSGALAQHTAPEAITHHAAPVSYAHRAAPISVAHHAGHAAVAHAVPAIALHSATVQHLSPLSLSVPSAIIAGHHGVHHSLHH